MKRGITLLVLLVAANDSLANTECPMHALEVPVLDPSDWADSCFLAVNGRRPNPKRAGESDKVLKDLDLDGVAERLEIRGVGNAAKSIYVFKPLEEGFRYLGAFSAHPRFDVARNASGVPVISYSHRLGSEEYVLVRYHYNGTHFVREQQ